MTPSFGPYPRFGAWKRRRASFSSGRPEEHPSRLKREHPGFMFPAGSSARIAAAKAVLNKSGRWARHQGIWVAPDRVMVGDRAAGNGFVSTYDSDFGKQML
jgi:hypothetical protein